MSNPYRYTNRNSNKNDGRGSNGGGNQNPYPPRRQNVPPSVWGQPPAAPPPGTAPPATSSLQQAAAGAGYAVPPRMPYYAPNPYAAYGAPPPQQPGMHRPAPAGMWQPAPPTSGMNVNPYSNPGVGRMSSSSMTYYPSTAAAASSPSPAAPPPAARKKKALVITDKHGNVVDFSKQAGDPKQSSLQAAAAAGPPATATTPAPAPETKSAASAGSDAGAKLRQMAMERLAEDEKKKQESDGAKAREADVAKVQGEKEAQKKREAEELLKVNEKKREEERLRGEKEAAAQKAVASTSAPPPARSRPSSLSSLAARLEKQEPTNDETVESKEEVKPSTSTSEPSPKASLPSLASRLERLSSNGEEDSSSPERRGVKDMQTVTTVSSPSKTTASSRNVYSKDQMLRFKALDTCCVRPANLPDLTIQLISVGGAGGGGGGGQRRGGQRGGGGDWSRGAAPPRQNSDRRNSAGQQDTPQWSRGQAPPKPPPQGRGGGHRDGRGGRGGRGGGPPPLYDGPIAPLVKSDKGWRPQKDTSTFAVTEKKVKSILNKMTLEKFDRLATQMCEIRILSYDILKMMIHNVYEKAIYEPTFGEMYAELCVRLSQSASASSFLQIIESDESLPEGDDSGGEKVYRWSNDVNTSDAEVVGPYSSARECIEAALEDEDEPSARGDMELELDSLTITEGKFIKIMKKADSTDEDGEKVFYTVFFPVDQHEECGQQLSGIFSTEKDCRTDSTKRNSFRRSLLNKCEDEFMKQDIYVDWKKEKAEYEAAKASLTDSEQTDKEEELEFRRIKIKKQMLGNIKFIGQLYKKGLLKEKIMRSCIASLLKLKSDEEASKYPEYVDSGDMDLDDEDHEAVQSLFTTIGKTIDLPHASSFMKVCFTKITKISEDDAFNARSRFMYKDLIELRENRWQPRRKEEKAKTLDEIRKDVEREERRQAQQSAQANFRGGKGDRRDSYSSRNRGGDYRGGDNRRGGQGHDSRGGEARQRSVSKPSTDEDGFTQVPVRRSVSKPQMSGHSDERGDKPIKILKKPVTEQRGNEPEPGPDPERERSAAAEADSEPRASNAPEPLSREKLERRIDTIRNEYIQDPNNEDELLLSVDELSGTPDAGVTLVSRNADRLMDCKDSERESIIAMLSLLFERTKLTSKDVQDGMAEVVEFIDSFVVDSPKAYEYLGAVLGELLHVEAVDIDWFIAQSQKAKPDPSSDAASKIVAKTIASVKSSHGDGDVKRLFGRQSNKLSALLGEENWERLAKEFDIA